MRTRSRSSRRAGDISSAHRVRARIRQRITGLDPVPSRVHASGHNLSAQDRWQVYVVYNPVTNRPEPVPNPRPDYVRSTNWTPLTFEGADVEQPV